MISRSTFKPAWWLPGAHAQTIWPGLFHHTPDLELVWERLELPDDDFIDLVWTKRKTGPVVIVLHGLEGSINSHYAKGILSAIHAHGWRGVLMHFRGCSGEHNRQARSYHSGETGDFRFLVQTLHEREPGERIAAVGFSLGGNVLLKYLGEYGNDALIDAAAAVSVPFVLSNGADQLERGLSRFYQRYLLFRLQTKMQDKFSNRDAPFSVKNIPQWNTFHLFDHYVTATLHGFKNGKTYYAKCSSRQYLKHIKTPTLIVHARDDPFMTEDAIPDESELADFVTLELSESGGHVGFIGGVFPWQPKYWLHLRLPLFLQSYLDT
jgi:predicted alpha/beta-fold hydrolase